VCSVDDDVGQHKSALDAGIVHDDSDVPIIHNGDEKEDDMAWMNDAEGGGEWPLDDGTLDEEEDDEESQIAPAKRRIGNDYSNVPRKRQSTDQDRSENGHGPSAETGSALTVLTFEFVDPAEPEGDYGSKDDPITTMSLMPDVLEENIGFLQGADDVRIVMP
jgi:hypothetical protein